MDIKSVFVLSLLIFEDSGANPSKNKEFIIKKQKQTIFSPFKYFFQLDSISKQNEQLDRLTIYLKMATAIRPSYRTAIYGSHPHFTLSICRLWPNPSENFGKKEDTISPVFIQCI